MHIRQVLRSHEYGGVLITGLLTLLVLTAIGFAATRSSVMENEISTNERNYKAAFYAAEIAMETAEGYIKQLDSLDDYSEGSGHYVEGVQPEWDNLKVWHSDSSFVLPAFPAGSQYFPDTDRPRYTIGPFYDRDTWGTGIRPTGGTHFFTIVGEGTGAKTDAKAFVTSRFAKRYTN